MGTFYKVSNNTIWLSGTGTTSEGYTEYTGGELSVGVKSYIQNIVIESACKLPSNCSYMFTNLSNVVDALDLSLVDASDVTNMSYMFSGCKCLGGVKGFNTSHVEDMSYMFEGCKYLETVDIDTSNVTNMEGMFMNSTLPGPQGMRTVFSLLDWDTSKVTNMANMFSGASMAYSQGLLDISNWDVSNVTDMSRMFFSITNLRYLDISHWSFHEGVNVSSMFEADYHTIASSLEVIVSPDWDTEKMGGLGNLFLGCNKLPNAPPLYEYVDYSKLARNSSDGGCFTAPLDYKPGLYYRREPYGYVVYFYGEPKPEYTEYTGGILMDPDYLKTVTSVEFHGTHDAVLPEDCNNLFNGFSSLTSIPILSRFDTSNVKNMSYFFANLPAIKELDLSSFNTSSVTDMSYMFYGKDYGSNYVKLDISGFDTSNVTNMEGMFCNCDDLNTIIFPTTFITSKVTNMSYMFNQCYYLKFADLATTLNTFDTSNVTTISRMFCNFGIEDYWEDIRLIDFSKWDTSKLENTSRRFMSTCIDAQHVIDTLDISHVSNLTGMFSNTCTADYSKNTELDLSSWVLNSTANTTNLFSGCNSLTHINVNWTYPITKWVVCSMFSGCSNLESIDMDTWDTSSVTAISGIFSGCSKLKKVDGRIFDACIKNITSLDGIEFIFSGCESLTELDLRGWDVSNILNCRHIFDGCSKLSEIYASDWDFLDSKIEREINKECMFSNCYNLPNYNPEYTDIKAAHDCFDSKTPAGYFMGVPRTYKVAYNNKYVSENDTICKDGTNANKLMKHSIKYWKSYSSEGV